MTFEINGNKEDISAMMVNSERYALGRKTYMVEWTCKFISNNLHLLTKKDRNVMIRDIENVDNYGYECDEKEWKALLEKLKGDD